MAERGKHPPGQDGATDHWEQSHTRGATLDVLAQEESRVEREGPKRKSGSTAAERSRTTARRLATAAERDKVARLRDLAAAARDRVAEARDDAAHARDRAAEARERGAAASGGNGAEPDATPDEPALSCAAIRAQAALERLAAAADREAAAADRRQAEGDRREAGMDELTDVFRRGTGELALNHEMDRARRSGRSLLVALVDVDGLKAVNDSRGHAAGDELLRDVAGAIISTMRSYDVTVRWGGDEFVCGLSDVTAAVASERVAEIQRELDARRPGTSISAGLAELVDGDSLESLVARADAALYRVKPTNGA